MHRCGTSLATLAALCAGGAVHGQLAFIDRSPEAGTANISLGRGAAMVDLDGDGRLDLVTANADGPNGYFRQRPDHTFEDVGSAWGIAPDSDTTWGTLVADFDNDGDCDIYFIVGGFLGSPTQNTLLRNNLNVDGTFTDVTQASGAGVGSAKNFGGTAFDYDHDGDLDLFLTTTRSDEPCVMLRNDGNLGFTDVSAAAGLVELGNFHHCSSGDYNNDGWMDIAVGHRGGANVLYRNNGDGTFTDVAALAGVESPLNNFGLVFDDFDNDGWMDIYVPKYHKLPLPQTSQVYMNNGDGTFTDVSDGSGLTSQADMGHNTGDLDADGYPDIFIGTGNPADRELDVLFLIVPDGSGGIIATDVSKSSGILANGPTRCHGIAIGDYDQDGFVDVYTNNGGVDGSAPDAPQENALWQNQGNANNWAAVKLTGVISNRSAIGTRLVAHTSAGRDVHRMLRCGNGFANTDSPIQHFGIGQDAFIESIDITWPNGLVQTIHDPPMGHVISVVEGVEDCNFNEVADADDIDQATSADVNGNGIPDECECLGDVDGDDVVGVSDLLDVLADWGPCAACPTDFNGNDVVEVGDLLAVLAAWGTCG